MSGQKESSSELIIIMYTELREWWVLLITWERFEQISLNHMCVLSSDQMLRYQWKEFQAWTLSGTHSYCILVTSAHLEPLWWLEHLLERKWCLLSESAVCRQDILNSIVLAVITNRSYQGVYPLPSWPLVANIFNGQLCSENFFCVRLSIMCSWFRFVHYKIKIFASLFL
jgi:hypothetical protein